MNTASGRKYLRAILKHMLTPEEVDGLFHVDADRSKTTLKSVPNWPNLGNVRLAEARLEEIKRLIAAAVTRG